MSIPRKRIVFDWDCTLFDLYGTKKLYPEAAETVAELSKIADLSILTAGNEEKQMEKIEGSGLQKFFDPIIVVPDKPDKLEALRQFLPGGKIVKSPFMKTDIIVVGDRREFEIKFGRELGFTTVQIMQGPHAHRIHKANLEKAHARIGILAELVPLIRNGHPVKK